MPYVFKQLSLNDLNQLKQLLKVFGDAFGENDTYQGDIPTDAYLMALLAKSNFIVLVALDGKEVVGGLTAYVLEKYEQNRREIYIYDLAIAEGHRRKGLARDLINILKSIAKELKAYVIFVQADPGDDPAIKLYESMGTREQVFHFDILPDEKQT